MGTLQGDVPLAEEHAHGYFSIQVPVGENSEVSGGFYVEEYKKPEYEVRVTTDKRRVLQGSQVQAVISARYFFGEPVANAAVKYVVHKFRYWSPLFYMDDDHSRDDNADDGYNSGGGAVVEGRGEPVAEGQLTHAVRPGADGTERE